MIKVESHPGIVLRYNWKLAGIKKDAAFLSKKIKYQGNDSFRIRFKNPAPYTSPTLLFLTTNLNKIGLKATDVSFSSSKDPKMKNMELKVGREEDERQDRLGQVFPYRIYAHSEGGQGKRARAHAATQRTVDLAKSVQHLALRVGCEVMVAGRRDKAVYSLVSVTALSPTSGCQAML